MQAILKAIEQALQERGVSARRASIEAVGSPDLIREMRRGRVPSIERLRALCRVLDLEFYIGPRRMPDDSPSETVPERPPWVDELITENRLLYDRLLKELTSLLQDPATDSEGAKGNRQQLPEGQLVDHLTVPFARYVRAAAGSGEMVFDETAAFRISFRRSMLPPWVRPSRLICIRASGDSMEPTLNDNDLILIDRSSTEPIDGQIFVIRTDEGLAVKRLRRTGRHWNLSSDNSAYPLRRAQAEDRLVGQVAWHGPLSVASRA